MEIISNSETETFKIAIQLAQIIQLGDVVALEGELGSGKTTFIKGLASGLGIKPELVTSPSFSLLHIYEQGRLKLYHVDLFRLANINQIEHLGLLEQSVGDGVMAIEWADRLGDIIPPDALTLRFEIISEHQRSIWIFGPERLTSAILTNE